jgi:pSer/pThr/pTyr-binding forkhead associated (FHA) protein
MKIRLEPLSHPEVGAITITDSLFALGRREEPFASLEGDAIAKLSRRHARIIQEHGNVYVVDLGSAHGTEVNGQRLTNGATVLRDRDILTLAGELSFNVSVEMQSSSAQTDALPTPGLQLSLIPVNADDDLDGVTIAEFPVVVTRNDPMFDRFRQKHPDDMRRVSRRHAVIALKGDAVCLEDLASSNGTFVQSVRLDERARALADGDVICFGGERVAYTVRLVKSRTDPPNTTGADEPLHDRAVQPQAAAQSADHAASAGLMQTKRVATSAPSPLIGSNHTQFISSATSFLEVFCAESGPDDASAGPQRAAAADQAIAANTPALHAGPLRKAVARLRRIWRAFSAGTNIDRRFVWAGGGLAAMLLVAAAAAYLFGVDRREIRARLDEGAFVESANAANRYLERKPDDSEANLWGDEALIRAVVPPWLAAIGEGKFTEAERLLSEARASYRFIRRGREMLRVLAWVGKLEAHMSARGGADGPVVMFRDEAMITALVREWEADSFRSQQLLDQVVTYSASFEAMHGRTFSHLSTLRNDSSVYVKAIAELKSAVRARLESRDTAGIRTLLGEFAVSYPRVGGLDALQQDLENYVVLADHVQRRELAEVVEKRSTLRFRTPIFASHVGSWLDRTLPPPAIAARYTEAAESWRRGNQAQAIEALQPLTEGQWGDVARRQIAHYQKIGADFEQLQASRERQGYRDRLIEFRASLRTPADEYFVRAIQADFASTREQRLAELALTLKRVRSQWEAYQGAGGIPAVVRVERNVSQRFAQQARRLSAVHADVAAGSRMYRLLDAPPPPEWSALAQEVINEAKRQRRWLQDLSIVLEPAQLRAKLQLLPEVTEQSQ